MSAEFPGVAHFLVSVFPTTDGYHYLTLKANIDILKFIQFSLTLPATDSSLPASPWV